MRLKNIAATFVLAVSCIFVTSSLPAHAAENIPVLQPAGIADNDTVLSVSFLSHIETAVAVHAEEERIEEETRKQEMRDALYQDIAFAKVEQGSYLNIRKKASQKSAWVGRICANQAAKVIKKKKGWLKISSGDVTGYVKASYMITGEKAVKHARKLVRRQNPDADIDLLEPEVIEASFSSAKSRKAIEKANKKKAADLVSEATQYIGNPYRWGGESLTKGADCSGFVKAVYAKYGVSLPHSSAAMRRVGREVDYKDIRKGDIVCYQGHVGIYAGNGQIVNAIDDEHGIGYSSVTYAPILTVRRIF